jgi:hypothetical protein
MSRNATLQVADYAAAIGAELVVIDTLSRCMTGADENAPKDMSTAVQNMDVIRTAGMGRTVHDARHTGKDKITMRGSSALDGHGRYDDPVGARAAGGHPHRGAHAG